MLTKRPPVNTIFLTSTDILTGGASHVVDVWIQRQNSFDIEQILSRAINSNSNNQIDITLKIYLQNQTAKATTHSPVREYFFDDQSGISGNVWHHGSKYEIAIKGMPERILDLCDVSENERESITLQLHAMSGRGLSVIALATGTIGRFVKNINDLKQTEKLSFVGLIGIQLNVSSTARRCMEVAARRNITMYLGTGHHPAAAYQLSHQIQLAVKPSDVADAGHIDISHSNQINKIIGTTRVYARASSQQKKYIYTAIKITDPNAARVDTIEIFQKLLAIKP